MKYLKYLLMLTLLTILNLQTNAHSIDEIRKTFREAVESSTLTDKLSIDLNKIVKPDPLVMAYIASLEALKAKHSWSPLSKLQYLDSHKKLMAEAVNRSPNNLEIRYLRFNIQNSIPTYLGYSTNLDEDKKFIVNAFINRKFDSNNKLLIKSVYLLMLEIKSVTADERLKMEKVYRSL